MHDETIKYQEILEAGKENPTLDTKTEEDPNLYQDAEGGHAKIDTDEGTEGKDKKNKSSISSKISSPAGAKLETPTPSGTPEERLEQTLNALFDGENLTEDFMVKTATIFEAAINERVSEIEENLLEQYQTALENTVEEVTSDLAEKLDDYLGYVVEQWMEENKLSVETGIRSDIAENFILGLKDLFETNYIEIPDEKYDVLEAINNENVNLHKELNTSLSENIEMKKLLLSHTCQEIFFEEASNMVDTDVERLASLSEGIEFENEDQYREKIRILKESYFDNNISQEFLNENAPISNNEDNSTYNDSNMNYYTSAITRHSKHNQI